MTDKEAIEGAKLKMKETLDKVAQREKEQKEAAQKQKEKDEQEAVALNQKFGSDDRRLQMVSDIIDEME